MSGAPSYSHILFNDLVCGLCGSKASSAWSGCEPVEDGTEQGHADGEQQGGGAHQLFIA